MKLHLVIFAFLCSLSFSLAAPVWIWSSKQPKDQDRVSFQKSFKIPNGGVSIAKLEFTCDNGATAYLGFRIQPTSFPGGSQPASELYGFMEVTLSDDGTTGTINSWSWETTGLPITVPEPGTATLGVLALAGLAWRRRRD